MKHPVIKVAKELNIHPDTIWKAKRRRRASVKLSEMLESVTGIDRLKFLYPDKYGDGWKYIGNGEI
jgi:hypothetical protein